MTIGMIVAVIAAIVAVLAVVIGWITFAFKVREFRNAQAQIARNAEEALETRIKRIFREEQALTAAQTEEELEALILRVCRAFTNSDEYLLRRDRQVITMAGSVVDEAFRLRSSSFADAKVVDKHIETTERRLVAIENQVAEGIGELRTHLDASTGAIHKTMGEVLKELRSNRR